MFNTEKEELANVRAQLSAAERDLRAAMEALMLAHPENVECDSDSCAECGEPYELRDGCDPTPECDRCAHALLEKVREAARAVVGEGKSERKTSAALP